MSKYAPLRDYLMRQRQQEFEMKFREIEDIIGASLPKSADRSQWWANTAGDDGHVQRELARSNETPRFVA